MTKKQNKQKLLDNLYAPFQKDIHSLPMDTSQAAQFVCGHGDPNSGIMLIGEAPGKCEDLEGKPFVGRSGKLLTRTIEDLGFNREDLFITNTVKCRPPGNRNPTPQEIAFFKEEILTKEIQIIEPRIIVIVGAIALKTLLGIKSISKVRGEKIIRDGITYMPIYHPAYILRNPSAREIFQKDLKRAITHSQA